MVVSAASLERVLRTADLAKLRWQTAVEPSLASGSKLFSPQKYSGRPPGDEPGARVGRLPGAELPGSGDSAGRGYIASAGQRLFARSARQMVQAAGDTLPARTGGNFQVRG